MRPCWLTTPTQPPLRTCRRANERSQTRFLAGISNSSRRLTRADLGRAKANLATLDVVGLVDDMLVVHGSGSAVMCCAHGDLLRGLCSQ